MRFRTCKAERACVQAECLFPSSLSGSECTGNVAGLAAVDESALLLAFRDSLVSDCAFTQLMSISLVLQPLKRPVLKFSMMVRHTHHHHWLPGLGRHATQCLLGRESPAKEGM